MDVHYHLCKLFLSAGTLNTDAYYSNTGFDVIFVLYCYSPVLTGGLAFTVRQLTSTVLHIDQHSMSSVVQAAEIGLALATSGAISAGLQLFFMPYLLRRFDHAKMYNSCMSIWPYCYVLLPGLNIIARMGLIEVDGVLGVHPATKAILWAGISVLLLMARVACLAFS